MMIIMMVVVSCEKMMIMVFTLVNKIFKNGFLAKFIQEIQLQSDTVHKFFLFICKLFCLIFWERKKNVSKKNEKKNSQWPNLIKTNYYYLDRTDQQQKKIMV